MKKTLYITLTLMAMSGLVATDIYLPSLPAITEHFSTTNALVQSTISIYLITFGLSQLISGTISDKYGRRPILLIGQTIFILGSLLTVMADSITVLLIGRAIQGLGVGASLSLTRIIMKDLLDGKYFGQAMGKLATGIALSIALAPVLGGAIQHAFGFQFIFLFVLTYAILLILLILRHVPETNKNKLKVLNVKENYKLLLSNRGFVMNLIVTGFVFSMVIIYSTINPFLMQNQLGYSVLTYSYFTLAIASGLGIGNFVYSRLIVHYESDQIMHFALILLVMASLVMLAGFEFIGLRTYILALPNFFIAIGAGIIFPGAISRALLPFHKISGSAGAIYGSVQVAISGLASYVAAHLPSQSAVTLALILLSLSLVSLLANFIARYNITPSEDLSF